MLIPLKFRLQNYCQHRDVTVELTNTVTALVAPNGAGKSNLLNGFKAILTGKMSESAEKLEDDIFDSAKECTLEGSFEDPQSGSILTITRVFKRKGSNSVKLKIKSKDGSLETIGAAKKATARLQKIIGYSPDTLATVIIAQQRGIEDLLFASTNKRISRFQEVWYGNTFTQLSEELNQERSKLFIDENASERLKGLQENLKQTTEKKKELSASLRTLNSTLTSLKEDKLLKKREDANQFASLKTSYTKILSSIESKNQDISKNLEFIQTVPKDLTAQIKLKESTKEEASKINTLLKDKDTLETEIKNTEVEIKKLQASLESTSSKLKEMESKLKIKDEISRCIEYKTWYNKLTLSLTSLQNLGPELAKKSSEITQLKEQLTTIRTFSDGSSLESNANTLTLLKQAKNIVHNMESMQHSSENCPICQQKMENVSLSQINDKIGILESQIYPRQGQEQQLLVKLEVLEKEKLDLTNEVMLSQANMESLNSSPISKPESPYTETPIENLINILHSITATPETLQELNLSKTRIEEQLNGLNSTLSKNSTSLNEKIKELPNDAKEVELNTLNREITNLTSLKSRLDIAENTNSIYTKDLVSLTKEKEDLEKEQLEKKLPSLSSTFELTNEEKNSLEELDKLKQDINSKKQDITGLDSVLTFTQEQIELTKKGISSADNTADYSKYLRDMEGVFKKLPKNILKSQLKMLCREIDKVVEKFQLQQAFKLSIDNKLDFIIKYDNGLTRSIKRCSGGERIILGLAFRLAAHKSLAPEIPFIAIDEPTNHLDETNIQLLSDLINTLSSNLSSFGLKKLLIATHSSQIAEKADCIINL